MRFIFLFLVFCIFTVTRIAAQSKPPLSVQGTLKNADGTSVADGNYNMTFRLYTASSGGTAVWTESQSNVPVRAGVYSVRLGVITPINITFTENLFLGTTVGNGAEIVPRTRLTSSPYALFAFKLGNDLPVGFLMPWASGSTTAPDGWLLCDGRALKSVEYPDLFAAIGNLWGNGSSGSGAGSGTDFNLPDLRGEFIRGAEAGANAGVQQSFSTAPASTPLFSTSSSGAHSHSLQVVNDWFYVVTGNVASVFWGVNGEPTTVSDISRHKTTHLFQLQFQASGAHTHTVGAITGGDAETRPRNVAMPYYIKVRN